MLILPLLLCGCDIRTEVGKKSFARILHIDGNAITLTLYDGEILSGIGKTPMSAVASAEAESGKIISIGHTELLLLGEGEYQPILEGFLKSGTPSPSCFVAYCSAQGGCDEETLDLPADLEVQEKNLTLARKNICQTLDGMLSLSQCAAVPYISGDIKGMAVIGKNGLIFRLSADASVGLSLLNGSAADTYDDTSAHIIAVRPDIGVSLENNRIIAEIRIGIRCSKPIEDEKALLERIERMCREALKETALAGYDTIGIEKILGACVAGMDNEEWRRLLKSGSYTVKSELD